MGHGVGGGSINTMCSTRGGKVDFDACVALVIMDGVGMICFHISRKRKNYQDEVDADFSHELYIHPNASTYSNGGYVHVSYPRYFYNQSRRFSL